MVQVAGADRNVDERTRTWEGWRLYEQALSTFPQLLQKSFAVIIKVNIKTSKYPMRCKHTKSPQETKTFIYFSTRSMKSRPPVNILRVLTFAVIRFVIL